MDWRTFVRAAAAAGLAAAMARFIWRVEWFDVFRWGIPGPGLLLVYAGYIGAAGTIGWFLAALLTPRPTKLETGRRRRGWRRSTAIR